MPFEAREDDERLEIPLPDCRLFGVIRRVSQDVHTHSKTSRPGMVVMVHGRLHRHAAGPGAELAQTGLLPFDVFTFDMRGCGLSTGETGYSNAPQEADDLHHVLQYLVERGEKIVALVGHSKGAVAVLMYASRYTSPCRFLVSLSGRYSPEGHDFASRWTEQQRQDLEEKGQMTWLNYRRGVNGSVRSPYVVTKEAVEQYKRTSLADFLPNIPDKSALHFLCVHGTSDGTVKKWNSESIVANLKELGVATDLLMLDGVAHNYDDEGEIELLARLVGAWLESRMSMKPVDGKKAIVDHLNRSAVQAAVEQAQV